MESMHYDLVVVGGGPAGAAAARAAVEGGMSTLLIEKKKMPRPKQCSGMIMPAARRYLQEYFGPLPEKVLASPPFKGSSWHLKGDRTINVHLDGDNVWRDRFDQWLCEESGAEIRDGTRLVDFAAWKDHVEIICLRNGEEVRLRSSAMVAADGVYSGVVKKIDPTFNDGLDCFYYRQDYYRCDVELEPGYFHVFLDPRFGLYPAAYVKDDILVVDSCVRAGEKIAPAHDRYCSSLSEKHGFKCHELVMTLGCRETGTPGFNRFCLGTDRVLVAGEAAGFINGYGEGISSALATGYLAGKAVVESGSSSPGPVYRESVAPERERTMKEWHLPDVISGRSNPDVTRAIMALPPKDILRLMPKIFAFGIKHKAFPGFHRGNLELSLRRLLHGDFNFRG
ncbi:MAG: NAD(P)/FAD-dependent oxidoreductase [Actinobacteria bacterium]|jgi:flavin-dependent dehydrogenase|nr:MAG: NAD(P)/FAD-dependent oxidoreductase [Actinomycetota bacterium]